MRIDFVDVVGQYGQVSVEAFLDLAEFIFAEASLCCVSGEHLNRIVYAYLLVRQPAAFRTTSQLFTGYCEVDVFHDVEAFDRSVGTTNGQDTHVVHGLPSVGVLHSFVTDSVFYDGHVVADEYGLDVSYDTQLSHSFQDLLGGDLYVNDTVTHVISGASSLSLFYSVHEHIHSLVTDAVYSYRLTMLLSSQNVSVHLYNS